MNYKIDPHSGLRYLEKENSNNTPVILLLHGYGANAMDLFPISDLKCFKPARWIFIEAPHAPPEIAAFGGKSWFHLDIAHFQKLISEGRFDEVYKRHPEDINIVHNKLSIFLDSLLIRPSQLILGGFSQGAITATDFILTKKIKPKALIHFSGSLIKYDIWSQHGFADIPIFQSHGHYDMTLPINGAHKFKELSNSKNHQFEVFEGGHEIPIEILKKCADFLKSL